MPSRPLFVYGTLRDPDILRAIIGRTMTAAQSRPAHAPGFIVVHYPGRVYPALIARPGGQAEGLLLTGLTRLDMQVLDAFEGSEYRREPIIVQIAGSRVEAGAYLPTMAIPDDAAPWTLADWTAHHKAQVLADETATALTLRTRLFMQEPGAHG